MGNGTLDPRSLTSEERAILDREIERTLAHENSPPLETVVGYAWAAMVPVLVTRRALLGEPASEPANADKFLPCGCVRCTCEDEIQCHGCGAKMCELHRLHREPASEGGKVECPEKGKWTGNVKCPDCGRLVNEAHCGGPNHVYQRVQPAQPEPVVQCRSRKGEPCDYNLAGQCIYCREFKPEPVAASDCERARAEGPWLREVLGPVAAEMPRKLCYADVAPVSTEQAIAAAKRLIDAAFGNKGEKPRFSIPVDLTRDDDVLLMAFIEQRSQPAPAAAMTEELDAVLEYLEEHCDWTDSRENGPVHTAAESHHARACIAAVRAQAAEAGIKLPKVRAALQDFDMDPTTPFDKRVLVDAALAELDAAEGRK